MAPDVSEGLLTRLDSGIVVDFQLILLGARGPEPFRKAKLDHMLAYAIGMRSKPCPRAWTPRALRTGHPPAAHWPEKPYAMPMRASLLPVEEWFRVVDRQAHLLHTLLALEARSTL